MKLFDEMRFPHTCISILLFLNCWVRPCMAQQQVEPAVIPQNITLLGLENSLGTLPTGSLFERFKQNQQTIGGLVPPEKNQIFTQQNQALIAPTNLAIDSKTLPKPFNSFTISSSAKSNLVTVQAMSGYSPIEPTFDTNYLRVSAAICVYIAHLVDSDSEVQSTIRSNWLSGQKLEMAQRDYQDTVLQAEVEQNASDTAYAVKFNNYNDAVLEGRLSALKWNSTQSKIIFVFAHFIMLIALVAAIGEFYQAIKHHETGRAMRLARLEALKGPSAIGANPDPREEIEIGPEKLAIKTSTRAIWLLLSAFAFYFLYIHFVYPLTEIK